MLDGVAVGERLAPDGVAVVVGDCVAVPEPDGVALTPDGVAVPVAVPVTVPEPDPEADTPRVSVAVAVTVADAVAVAEAVIYVQGQKRCDVPSATAAHVPTPPP